MIKELELHELEMVSGAGLGDSLGSIIGAITHPASNNGLYNLGDVLEKTGDGLSGLYGNIGQAAPKPLQPAVPWAILGGGTAAGGAAGAAGGAVAGGLLGALIGGVLGGAALSPI
ncbi:hypothetical protein [uncultured Pluralibacter sp.]|uniref:hypothetical protein n=1 Tax=uncultured Pluralibacter sp. TaxID=1490864 RepID=UPI00260A1D1B|nr:hypothetical protein [uncultured Pluralibacter sp.]